MTGPLLIAATAVSLSLLVALMALSLGVADWLERRQCTCLFEDWPAAIGTEMDEDGLEWVVYPACKMHGHRPRTRINETTASGQTLTV